MSRFSILLIENQISATPKVVTTLSQHLDSFTLSVTKSISDAITEHRYIHVILLNVSLLSSGPSGQFSSLKNAFPNVPVILLTPPLVTNLTNEEILLEALAQGASDFSDLSKIGLLMLGRRLASMQNNWANQSDSPIPTTNNLLGTAIANDASQLAIQLIGVDNRIKAWNEASEEFFAIKKEQAVGNLIDELPLSVNNLSRLKDMLDQARTTERPFFIPIYHLDSPGQTDPQPVHVHVYPIYKNLSPQSSSLQDICIIITKLPDLKQQIDTNNLRHNQEMQILLKANREISGQLEVQPTLEKVTEQTKYLLYGDNCQIYFLEKDNITLRPVMAVGPLCQQIQATPLTMGQGVIGQIAATGKAVITNNIDQKSEIPYQRDEHLLSAPLTAIGGTIGLMIISRRTTPFSQDDLYFFETLVQQASSAINNARLFEETARSLNELATLYEASTAIATHWNDQDVLNTLIQKTVQVIDVRRGFIVFWNKEQNKGIIEAEYSNEVSSQNQSISETIIDLSERNSLLTILNQKRPFFFNLNNPSLDKVERKALENSGYLSRLLIPLVTKGETIGWVELCETRQERTFTADEVRMSRTLATQIAVALQNTHYLRQTERTLEETTALYRVASELTTLQDPQAIISTVLQEYLYALKLKQGSIVSFDFAQKCAIVRAHIKDDDPVEPASVPQSSNQERYKISEGRQIPLQNNPVYERLMRTWQPVIIDDPQAGWITSSRSARAGVNTLPVGGWADEESFSVLVVPIKMRGEITGALIAENTRNTRPFDKWAASLGQAMADQLGVGLQNVELYESEYQRREQAETLREVSSVVGSSLNLNEVLERILDQLGRVIKYDSAAIHLIEGNQRRVIAGRGFKNPKEHIGLTFPIQPKDDEPGSMVIYTRKPVVYDDISEFNESFRESRHQHIRSWIGIPLIARDRVIGLISIDHKKIGAYSEEDVQLAQAFANQVAIALENARLYNLEVTEFERELDFAQEIQETLLPQFIPQVLGLDIAGRIVPARQVGGDFFHFFSTDSEQLGVAIGDVSGKGIPAALYMAAGITAIDIQTGPDTMPGELLNKLNGKLYNRLQENRMNIALQVATFIPLPHSENIDSATKQQARGSIMTVANAGMIAPIGATQHGCRFLPVGGFPIGALPSSEIEYFDEVFLLDPLTTIIFTSDGIVEAQNEFGELFGFDRLEAVILEIVDKGDAGAIAEYIVDKTQEFVGTAEQHDDMTVVVVVKK